MSNNKLQEFHKDYPYPAEEGVDTLYKFMSFNSEYPEYLKKYWWV